jgi:hypothetical protein
VERITAAGGRPVGAVLNLVPRRHRAGGYSTYAYGAPPNGRSTKTPTAARAELHEQKAREPDAPETPVGRLGHQPGNPRQWTVNGSGTGWPELPGVDRPSKRP